PTARAGIGVAIPLPRIYSVEFDLPIHLLKERGPIGLVLYLVPIVVRCAVALRQRALAAGQIVQVLFALGHQPARETGAASVGALEHLAAVIALFFFGWHAADDDHARFAIE